MKEQKIIKIELFKNMIFNLILLTLIFGAFSLFILSQFNNYLYKSVDQEIMQYKQQLEDISDFVVNSNKTKSENELTDEELTAEVQKNIDKIANPRVVTILRDETGKFAKAVEKFNKDRLVELNEIEEAKKTLKNKNFIAYINEAIRAINKYNIDPQGFFEYIRFLIEESGIKIEKIWKEDKKANEKRYERCLYFEFNNKTYLLDSIEKTLSIANIDDLDQNLFIFNSAENQYEYYGG